MLDAEIMKIVTLAGEDGIERKNRRELNSYVYA